MCNKSKISKTLSSNSNKEEAKETQTLGLQIEEHSHSFKWMLIACRPAKWSLLGLMAVLLLEVWLALVARITSIIIRVHRKLGINRFTKTQLDLAIKQIQIWWMVQFKAQMEACYLMGWFFRTTRLMTSMVIYKIGLKTNRGAWVWEVNSKVFIPQIWPRSLKLLMVAATNIIIHSTDL